MKIRNIIIAGSFITLSLGLFLYSTWKKQDLIHTAEEQREINASEDDQGPVDLILSAQEQMDISRWKNRSMDDLYKDASNGDRAALYNLGSYSQLGIDTPINVNVANLYFAQSASFGYAPALHEISQMYLYDKPNPWLNLVYMNLTIAFGHTEFTRAYHILRNETVKIVGRAITTEIERLAAQKMSCLLKNQNDFENAVNKAAFFASMQYITDEDSKYGQDYWITLYQKRNPSKQDSCN